LEGVRALTHGVTSQEFFTVRNSVSAD